MLIHIGVNMIISILNQKGGAGKTTISTNLARGFVLRDFGKVLLVDSDPQGSARDWNVAGDGEILNVVGLDRPTLPKDILSVKHDYSYIFIDGAPGLAPMAIGAIKCSDIILIPVQPSPYDLWATEDLIGLISERISWSGGKVKAAFVVNAQIPNTIIGKEIKEVLDQYRISHGISVFQSSTVRRVAYATSASQGKTVLESEDKAASSEIYKMVDELKEFSA